MEKIVSLLREIGFSELEARIYVFLLSNGKTTPTELSLFLGVHKPTLYNAVKLLEGKGLVTKVKVGKEVYFQASPSSTLIGLIKNIESEVSSLLSKVEKQEKSSIEVYKGKRAVRNLMRRMLVEMENGERFYYDFGASGLFRVVLPAFWDYWQAYKKKAKISSLVLFTDAARKLGTLVKDYYGEARFLPENVYSFTDTFIYNDVVVLFIWSDEPIAVYIKNKKNAESYKRQFEAMWKIFR